MAFIGVTAAALAARLLPWERVFTPDGVRLLSDSDPYYHVLGARRLLAEWPHIPWRDPEMDYPAGADILWPPLFDAVIAGSARLAGATGNGLERLAETAAIIPVVLGLAVLLSVTALARRLLGREAGLLSALIVALLPASLRFSSVGTADHHVAELLFAVWMVHAFVRGWSDEAVSSTRFSAELLAGFTVIAFWNWQGSALALMPIVIFTGVWHVIAAPGDPTPRRAERCLAWGGAGAAILLATTIAAWGPPGAFSRASLSGIGITQVAVCAMAASFGALLAAAGRLDEVRGRWRRATEVGVAAIVPLSAALLFPPVRGGFGHGLTALTAGNPWFRTIDEFRPLFGRATSVADMAVMSMAGFGGALLAAPVAAVVLGFLWKLKSADRPRIAFLVLWGLFFLVLTLARKRFSLYLIVPLALWCEIAVRAIAWAASRKCRSHQVAARRIVVAVAIVILIGPALPMVWLGGHVAPDRLQSEVLVPLARDLSELAGPPGRPAVIAGWTAGHIIRYFSGKPVIATPFGTDLGPDGMQDLATFQFSTDPGAVEDLLERRRVGFVLLRAPATEGRAMLGFLPPGVPRPFDLVHDNGSRRLQLGPDYIRLVTSRLYHFDGMAPRTHPLPTLESYRLLAESEGNAIDYGSEFPGPPYKLFGIVPGVRLTVRGLSPADPVFVTARIATNRGRIFDWTTNVQPDERGTARLRLPYATGSNGLSRADAYRIFQSGGGRGTLQVAEAQVLLGGGAEITIHR